MPAVWLWAAFDPFLSLSLAIMNDSSAQGADVQGRLGRGQLLDNPASSSLGKGDVRCYRCWSGSETRLAGLRARAAGSAAISRGRYSPCTRSAINGHLSFSSLQRAGEIDPLLALPDFPIEQPRYRA